MSSNQDKIPLSIILDWEDIIVAGLKRVWERSKSITPPPSEDQKEYVGTFLLAASEKMVEQLIESDEYELVTKHKREQWSGHQRGLEPIVVKK